jgi:hypothetical protein
VTPGIIGQGLSCDGSDDYVAIANSASLRPGTGNWSVAFWMNRQGVGSGDFPQVIGLRPWTEALDNGWAVAWRSATGVITGHYADGSTGFDVGGLTGSEATADVGVWSHWVVVFDRTNGNLNFYKNGTLDVQRTPTFPTGSINNSTDNANICREIGGSNNRRLNALLDEIRVYNRALSAAEIAELYRAGAPTERSKVNTGGAIVNPSGLKAYLAFDGPSVSGTTVTDLSNNGNNGVLANGATVDIGVVGQSLKCDGVNDYLTINDANVVGNTVTTTFWVKSIGKNSGWGRIVSKTGAATNSPGWEMMVNSAGPAIRVRISTSVNAVQDFYANGEELDGRWHHIALTISGGTLELFRDGVSAGTQTYSEGTGIANSGAALRLCVRTENVGDARFEGQIDEFRLYDRVLSAGEIKQLYDATKRE